MTEVRLSEVRMRGILESRGQRTVEAEIRFDGGAHGRGAAPVAIAPGRREQRRSRIQSLGALQGRAHHRLAVSLEKVSFRSQQAFDEALEDSREGQALGADVRLALSLAFWRAWSHEVSTEPVRVLAALTSSRPALPRPLVNVFSGGIHAPGRDPAFQQIMLAPDLGALLPNLDAALEVFGEVEARQAAEAGPGRYSASSGLLIEGVSHGALLARLRRAADGLGFDGSTMPLGADVAAEHLRLPDGGYRLGSRNLGGAALLHHLEGLAREHKLSFLEDPFDPEDTELWRELTRRLAPDVLVVGDDLFATQWRHIEPGLASAIVLKPNQIGTVSATLRAAVTARRAGMALCVSHRSGETEDTAVCDLAVAVGATHIKIGGPRRGDRIAKYNQLVRLAEAVGEDQSMAVRSGDTAAAEATISGGQP